MFIHNSWGCKGPGSASLPKIFFFNLGMHNFSPLSKYRYTISGRPKVLCHYILRFIMKFNLIPCRGVLVYSSPDNHVNYLISDFISILKSSSFSRRLFVIFCFLFLVCLIFFFFFFLVELLVGHCPTCPGGCYATDYICIYFCE